MKIEHTKSVLDYFNAQVHLAPNINAISDGSSSLSYQELNNRAAQMANWLDSQGIEQGDSVALLFDASIEYVIVVFAIIKIGAIFIPLDTKAPPKRLVYILEDANPKLVISNLAHDECTLGAFTLHIIKNISHTIDDFHPIFNDVKQNPNDAICVFYTSGTTGVPKGVVITHQAIVNLNKASNFFNIGQSDVVVQFSNLAFDAVTFEIFGALLNGGTLLVIPTKIKNDFTEFREFLSKENPTIVFLTTAYFNQLINSMPSTVDALETILFGGEAVDMNLVNKFLRYREKNGRPVKLLHVYGPTEATTFTTYKLFDLSTPENELLPNIGRPIENVCTYVLDKFLNPVAPGDIGELFISGVNLAACYINSSEFTAEKFLQNPFSNDALYQKMYRTGDLVRELSNKDIQYVGRIDDQVKISGYRIHLNEIETEILKHPAIGFANVLVEKGGDHHLFLVAYLVFSDPTKIISSDSLRNYLSQSLPSYMLPAKYLKIVQMPLNANGKIDKKKLKKIPATDLSRLATPIPVSAVEDRIKRIWEHLLDTTNIDMTVNLFDLGANSLMLLSACVKINEALQCELTVADMIACPSVRLLSEYLGGRQQELIAPQKIKTPPMAIAIVGMACRFPSAKSVQEYWDNLCANRDCLTRTTISETSPYFYQKNFVPVRGIVSGIDQFDASFFEFSPSDASLLDPQQRLFLECAWEAFEHAGVMPQKNPDKKVSAFCGMADSSYLQENILKNQQYQQQDWFSTRISTSIGTLSTQLSYRLNLRGKSININTACSTSLVAVEQACQDLTSWQSDIALAGGVSIDLHHRDGYLYQEGGIESSDGYCRPFSADANGTVFSDGVGVVILKRLEDAINDNDTIYAVIKGCGINNDGANKLGYAAPSVAGQTQCILDALTQSGISSEQIGLVEAHGTATALGDVIEFGALSKAYQNSTEKNNYCLLGSAKGNIGHTDIAAGMAGLIKATLCLYEKKNPATRHFSKVNPHINLRESPFYITDQLIEWASDQTRYAGVSAFGIGGTNAHIILTEHLQEPVSVIEQEEQLMIVSAKNKKALEQNTAKLINFLDITSHYEKTDALCNAAYTLQTGRHDFQWRNFSIGRTSQDIEKGFNTLQPVSCPTNEPQSVVFMFPGQGTQYAAMALSLLKTEPYFAAIIEQVNAIAGNYVEHNLLDVIRNNPSDFLHQTQYTQPALFIIEYALAKLLMHYGIQPHALIGHSIGEYVAACLADVFSLKDAIKLVCQRGLCMAKAPKGAMLAIECNDIEFFDLTQGLPVELALHNSIGQCVASGSGEAIDILSHRLSQHNKIHSRLMVSHAFHSQRMQQASNQFEHCFEGITLSPPKIPVISNVTGTWLTGHEATSPQYWTKHLRQTVLFKQGIDTLTNENHSCFIEIGPGNALSSWAKEIQDNLNKSSCITHTLPNHRREINDRHQLLNAVGRLWQQGIAINWAALHEEKKRRHIPLPTYSFQRQRYWIEPDADCVTNKKKRSIDQWCYEPSWVRKQNYHALTNNFIDEASKYTWIVFQHSTKALHPIITILRESRAKFIIIEAGNHFDKLSPNHYVIDIGSRSHFDRVFDAIKNIVDSPAIILHRLSCTQNGTGLLSQNQIDDELNNSFYSALWIVQSYMQYIDSDIPLKFALISNGTQQILCDEPLSPVRASLAGISHVIAQEHSFIKTRLIDITEIEDRQVAIAIIHQCLENEWNAPSRVVAYRKGYRWERIHSPTQIKSTQSRLRDGGIYLFTGGLGGIALTLCEAILNQITNPVFVLLSRRQIPDQSEWEKILNNDQHSWHSTITAVQRLRDRGSIVDVIACDITRESDLQTTLNRVINTHGTINGLIHTAGVAGGTLAQRSTKDGASIVLAPKIHGTYYLARALHAVRLDFTVLCSSIASALGIVGLTDYSAANACLDAFAESHLFNSEFTVSINWNTWLSVGMAVDATHPDDISYMRKGNDIDPKQAQQLFIKILDSHCSNVAISCFDIEYYSRIVNQPDSSTSTPAAAVFDREELQGSAQYAAPTNPLEKKLIELWQVLLSIESLGIDDDFFALGGHSLKALRFIEAVNKNNLGKLSLQDLYEEKTISNLAKKMTTNANFENAIVKLANQPGNVGNVFMLHPVSGTSFCFSTIAQHWNSPFNLYGLQDPSISTGHFDFLSLPDMAQFYLKKIQQIQPHGPYRFVGYSFGGTLAYEMTQLLHIQGEPVDLLALIDSWAMFSEIQYDENEFKRLMRFYNPELSTLMIDLAWQRMQILIIHKPSEINQKMILFKAVQLMEEYKVVDDAYNGWKGHNHADIQKYAINGNHETIIYPENSMVILDILRKELSHRLP